jgi:hypothetical protein
LPDGPAKAPLLVEVHQPDPGASEALIATLRPLAGPFTTSGIVVIFLIFFLFQREDIRDRFIRLLGSEDLERTTAALDDAAQRLGRLFPTQLVLNATFGVVIGLGPERASLGIAGDGSSICALHRRNPGRWFAYRFGCGGRN